MSFKEKLGNMKIDMIQFYKMGIVFFIVIGFANLFTLIHQWDLLILSAKVSSLFGVLFNFGIVLFFNYLRETLPKNNIEQKKEIEDVDFEGMINKLD